MKSTSGFVSYPHRVTKVDARSFTNQICRIGCSCSVEFTYVYAATMELSGRLFNMQPLQTDQERFSRSEKLTPVQH
jgi:hypothetical protein